MSHIMLRSQSTYMVIFLVACIILWTNTSSEHINSELCSTVIQYRYFYQLNFFFFNFCFVCFALSTTAEDKELNLKRKSVFAI